MVWYDDIVVRSEVERHQPSLPRFVVVPDGELETWGLEQTTVVEVSINGESLGRRSLKAWGPGRDVWFFDLTAAHCDRLGVDTGDVVEVRIRPAETSLPSELVAVLEDDDAARAIWKGLTEARRRAISEHVREAKHEVTRTRRAKKALAQESARRTAP